MVVDPPAVCHKLIAKMSAVQKVVRGVACGFQSRCSEAA